MLASVAAKYDKTVRAIIAGSRGLSDFATVESAVADAQAGSDFVITAVLSGAGPGVDALGEQWAREHGVPVKTFPADYGRYGSGAEPVRNGRMAQPRWRWSPLARTPARMRTRLSGPCLIG
jgi:hypothetical protein